LLLILLSALTLLFIIAPLLSLLLHTTPSSVSETVADPEVTSSIWLTIWTSALATLVLSVGAIPLAYLMSRRQFRFKRLVTGIIDLPVVIPHSAAGIALLSVISGDSLIGKSSEYFGHTIVGTPVGIMIAMAFVSLPFLINSARDGFSDVPVRLEQAAQNLGASSIRVFFTISLPLAWKSIISGFVMMFARGMSEFGAVIIITYHPMITPILIFERFGAFGLKYARPVAVLFIAVCLIFFILLRYLTREKNHHA
jgi:molybdate/tungstate transport system permease protein